jgi:hypothetical protein
MKRWPNARWAQLVARLRDRARVRVIFVGAGPEDERNYAEICGLLGSAPESLIGRLTLVELLALLRACDGLVGVDSGPQNLAQLAATPSVTIFGPGPHFYLPDSPRQIALDKSRGRGLCQMFVGRRRGFIHAVSVDEAYGACERALRLPTAPASPSAAGCRSSADMTLASSSGRTSPRPGSS